MIGLSVRRQWSLLFCALLITVVTVSNVQGSSIMDMPALVKLVQTTMRDPRFPLVMSVFFFGAAALCKGRQTINSNTDESSLAVSVHNSIQNILRRDNRAVLLQYAFIGLGWNSIFLFIYSAISVGRNK